MRLSDAPLGVEMCVVLVHAEGENDAIAQRLGALGFVAGEPVRSVARGWFGGDPLLIQIGSTRFALRRSEASRIFVRAEAA